MPFATRRRRSVPARYARIDPEWYRRSTSVRICTYSIRSSERGSEVLTMPYTDGPCTPAPAYSRPMSPVDEVAEPLAVPHDDVLVEAERVPDLGALLRGRERGDRLDRVTRKESGEDRREERDDERARRPAESAAERSLPRGPLPLLRVRITSLETLSSDRQHLPPSHHRPSTGCPVGSPGNGAVPSGRFGPRMPWTSGL